VPHYEFGGRVYLEEVIKEHYFTHYTPKDSELESRLKEIDSTFYPKNQAKSFSKKCTGRGQL